MIICLNGTSSSGKTSVARELHELLPGYFLYYSIDNILYSLPQSALNRMTTGQKNPGLDYWQLEEGYYLSALALAKRGLNLIIDNSIVRERTAKFFRRTLGEPESQLPYIHQFSGYDLKLDSTKKRPPCLAADIQSLINLNEKARAFEAIEL